MTIKTQTIVNELDNQLMEGVLTKEQYINAMLILFGYK